jgi:hypothetical protein
MKLNNEKGVGIFVETVSNLGKEAKKGRIIFLDLSKRKSIVGQGKCMQGQFGLTIGEQEILLCQQQPHLLSIKNIGHLIPSEMRANEMFNSSKQDLVIDQLSIFVLYPS